MKLMLAIINNDDANYVNSALRAEGHSTTKIASTGGFLLKGNTTFLVGVEDEKVDKVMEIISKYSKKRVVSVPADPVYELAAMSMVPNKVTIGGATVFIIDVEKFIHL